MLPSTRPKQWSCSVWKIQTINMIVWKHFDTGCVAKNLNCVLCSAWTSSHLCARWRASVFYKQYFMRHCLIIVYLHLGCKCCAIQGRNQNQTIYFSTHAYNDKNISLRNIYWLYLLVFTSLMRNLVLNGNWCHILAMYYQSYTIQYILYHFMSNQIFTAYLAQCMGCIKLSRLLSKYFGKFI